MVKANSLKQESQPLERIYSQLHRWKEIDRRLPDPLQCPKDINLYNQLQQQNRLYQLLQAINNEYDAEKRVILKTDPLPSGEEAYSQN